MEDISALKSILPNPDSELLSAITNPSILGQEYFSLLKRATNLLARENYEDVCQLCEILLDMAWEKLNTGYWKDVNINWRYAYSVSSVLKVFGQSVMLNHQKGDVTLGEIMRSCDMGLLMGAPIFDNILARMSTKIQSIFGSTGKRTLNFEENQDAKKPKFDYVPLDESRTVPKLACPSLFLFKEKFMDVKQAVVLTDCMDYWPALSSRKWSLDYIKAKAGSRTVPIEIGSKYTEDSWSQSLMTITEFIEKYIEDQHQTTKGYLAQHQLFEQIPELQSDISIPTYCSLGDSEDVDINAWFGPKGTVSPLHHDPKHNLLAQVVGWKYVRLYSDEVSEMLYPHPHRLLINTSQVDLENPDLEKFPLFEKAPYLECVLGPGEMLYIPPKHWHFVKSLSVSFSVSFWWE